MKNTRGLVLFSGSLASVLAVQLAQRAGLRELYLLFLRSPFFRNEEGVARTARALKLPLRSVTMKREFLRLPTMDGKAFPCGPCRRVLLERAARILRRHKFDLVVTGEVVGNGGLSAEELALLDEEVGLAGRVFRPLSARLLPPTLAEREGLVDRGGTLDLRAEDSLLTRLPGLAQELGISLRVSERHCLLADPVFAQRCQELGRDRNLRFTANLLQLLEFPHLFRLPYGTVLVVATTPAEQVRLQDLFLPEDVRLYLALPGSPLGLVRGPWTKLPPEAREHVVRVAAQKLLMLGGFNTSLAFTVCFRTEEAEETTRLRLAPLQGGFSLVN
ncbi:MAG: hypothetical protein ACK42E_02135 [Candidatus Bipolaricaulaceae bacterium]